MKLRFRAIVRSAVCSGLLLASIGSALAQTQEERALTAVREQLQALQGRLDRSNADRERQYGELRRIELDGAAAAAALEELRGRLAQQQARRVEIDTQSNETRVRLGREREALANQVKMSYLTGREETIKLMLNQEAPERLGRMMVYYDYLNRTRSRRIDNVSRELEVLAGLAEEAQQATRALAALEADQQRELDGLEELRAERAVAVTALDATIDSAEQEIDRLRAEEQRLTELVREINEVLAEFPVDSQEPFSASRGQLAWPIPGTVLSRFGQSRAGAQVRWQGVQVGAPAGTPVRSVYHGRIVFSDWLPGHGLLIIVDHGEGYMSLYGHNEVLLKESGDWVAPGEVIAQVGDSGGQAQTALYFEIRRDGDPVDPQPWMSRAEPQR
ncbi:MAG: peptidoglycan DD-metalloendopeptidase family protein [Gammaproteobacteria bacterium]|nr:peptidoglycan DD-metalloendopeptidase family protein [Gammaproteobacteria bacterium]